MACSEYALVEIPQLAKKDRRADDSAIACYSNQLNLSDGSDGTNSDDDCASDETLTRQPFL